MMDEEEEEDGEDRGTVLKSVAADLLKSICLHQDGSVTELFDYCFGVLKG